MTRAALVLTLIFAFCLPLHADSSRPLGQALAAARSADWDVALRRARADGPVAADVIEWMRLRAGLGAATEVTAFLERRPDWPGEALLRRRSELAIITADDATILRVFAETPAQTAAGALAHAGALVRNGESGEAHATLVLAWRTMRLSKNVQDAYMARHKSLLAPHHEARLDAMLWARHRDDAARMLPLVSKGATALARARIALQKLAKNVDRRIAEVPKSHADAPGLAHDRFIWRMRKGRPDSARELLLERSTSAEALGQPEGWARHRRTLARAQMRAGNHKTAYRLASRHFLESGSNFADLEWLAGYIALRFLDQPQAALTHFRNHDSAVVTPISKGRAGYWIGRAYEAMGDSANADMSYASGAQYQTSFYGLLAAERADLPVDPDLGGRAEVPDWRGSDLAQRDLFIAGQLLLDAGEIDMAERFWTHLAESLDQDAAAQLGQAAIDLDQPHIAVMIGKRLARRAIVEPAPYYALHPVADADLTMAPEMLLAIARRESEFDPRVVSGAGARGLMQIMPATAREVAASLGKAKKHSQSRLTSDPEWNAELGAAYLSQMAGRFGGNVVLMSAAYNAGPSRPAAWMRDYGDPRTLSGDFDVIDWIEHIPFRETRNYVMRVAESLPVYRARLGRDPLPVAFSAELTGSSLLAFAPQGE